MAIKDATKNIIANELIAMIREMPIEKVRIGDLCRRCGADRRTFYYHFTDKYDLVAWIFMRDYMTSLEAEQGHFTLQHSINILEKMYHNRKFYRSVFSDNSQNAIRHYTYQFFYKLGTDAMKAHFGLDTLPPVMEYAVMSHSHATIEITMEWLLGEHDYTPEQFARLQYRFMPQELKEAYGIEGEY